MGRRTLPVWIGLPEERPGWSKEVGQKLVESVTRALRGWGFSPEVVALPQGHAAGFAALAQGAEALRKGTAEFCLVGGVEGYLDEEMLDWLDAEGQLFRRGNPRGFIPGEGAGFCLLASEGMATRLGRPLLGQVLGVGVGHEPKRIKTAMVCTGEGLSVAFRGALASLPEGMLVDQLIGDLNGEPCRADEVGFTVVRLRKRLADPPRLLAPSTSWGDVGAASGPLFAGLAVEVARRGAPRGPCSLLWAGSEGGLRGAAVVFVPGQATTA
ncbi:beta-ketoacyl synthase N-terminal-like domain-containing protein [Chondromyces apiculatus]|uniref:beta-ketoacyl synthase N-terminal-like domain-containing protein n=1 Tax=Chondromyces apiculatus TaxID=51 RepID=UPI0018CC55C0|nr:beta-ketoacyl synthase N-terminal-like domain-containing protein [Chondromyces apiculatus]